MIKLPLPCFEASVHITIDERCGWFDKEVYLKEHVDATLDELLALNEFYRKNMSRFGTLAARRFFAIYTANRSLWFTRMERAKAMVAIDNFESYKCKHPCGVWYGKDYDDWVVAWKNVETLCLKQMEKWK